MKKKRWFYVVIGAIVMLFPGVVYAWSILSRPIANDFPEWSETQLSLTFTIMMVMFCFGGMMGGLLSQRVKPRIILWTSAVLFLAGFLLCAKTETVFMLYVSFGVICGFAGGLAYNVVIGTVTRWFPDRQGLVSGVLLMSFGFSSFLIGKIYQFVTPEVTGAWRLSFTMFGIIIAVIFFVCGLFLVQPPENMELPVSNEKMALNSTGAAIEMKPREMVKNPAFQLCFLWCLLIGAGGMTVISQASGIVMQVAPTMSAATTASIVGMISIFSGVGRITFGGLYDKIGRSKSMHLCNGIVIAMAFVLLVTSKTGSIAALVVGFIICGISCGSSSPVIAAFISSYFGLKNYAMNVSLLLVASMFSSFGSTIAGAVYDATQSYDISYLIIIGFAVASIFLLRGIDKYDQVQKAVKAST